MNFKTIKLATLFSTLALSSSLATAGAVEDTAITAAVKASLILEKDIPATAQRYDKRQCCYSKR